MFKKHQTFVINQHFYQLSQLQSQDLRNLSAFSMTGYIPATVSAKHKKAAVRLLLQEGACFAS